MNKMIESAIEYAERFNYPVIPCSPKDKKPLVRWTEFQKRKSTRQEIEEWWGKWPDAMIGAITGRISGDFVIDIDNLEGEEMLYEYLPDNLETPTSKTPRGGKHLHFQHPEQDITIKSALFPHVDYRGSGGFICMPPSSNSEGKKYIWLEGLSLNDVKKSELPPKLLEYINKTIFYQYKTNGLQTVTSVTNGNIFFNHGRRDQDLFHIANQLIKTKTDENMVRYILEILAQTSSPAFPLKEAMEKVNSAIDRAKRKERHLTDEIRQWVSITNRNFSIALAYQELNIVTPDEKSKSRVIFKRLVDEEKILERVTDRDGWYRRIEDQAEEMKWWESTGKEIKLIWPFELEKYFRTLTKNIIVVAGSPDSGKTAFLLNFCLNNMDKHNIYYFTSEASEEEINDRLNGFGIPNYKERFKAVKFFSKSSNFHDLIKPDEINIVDYLEMPEEPWKIGIFIHKIHEKLDKGICLIALQKPMSRDVARGGEVTLDRPKLYVSIGRDLKTKEHTLKIIKCKNWRDRSQNPHGLSINFKLIAGCNIKKTTEWGTPWEDMTK